MPNTIKRCTQITPTVEFTTLYDDDSIDTSLWNTGWGVVAQGSFKAGLPTPIAVTATGQMITDPLVVTMLSGRRYRIVCQLRAVFGGASAITLRMIPFDGGASRATAWGDVYCNAVATSAAFDSLESGFVVDGDGAAHSIEIQILCNAGATASAYHNSNCRFYVEDIGPVVRGSTGAAPVDWTAADTRYVNVGGDTMTGELVLPSADPVNTYGAVNADYMHRWINLVGGEKADKVVNINTTAPLQGGGSLAATRTLTIDTFTTAVKGAVPAPLTVSGRYLSDNGSWAVPPGGGDLTQAVADTRYVSKITQAYTGGWQPWTPILSVWGLSNGTLTGSYCQINNTVYFVFKLTIGSGTTFGTGPIIGGFPVGIHADFFESHFPLGVYCSGLNSTGVGRYANASQATLDTYSTESGTNPVQLGVGSLTAAVPASFVAGSRIIGTGFYKAA